VKARFIVGGVLLVGAAYFALFGGEYSVFEVRRIRRETAQEQARLDAAQEEVSRLRARADSLQDDSSAIERVARERWGLIRPGERLYRFEEADSARARDSAQGAGAASDRDSGRSMRTRR
jgi:cell division protein FtsB